MPKKQMSESEKMNTSLREGLLKKYKPLKLLADGPRKKLAKRMSLKIGLSNLKVLEQI
jgi:hypothetical protein